jgi:heptosyltransferase-1
MEQFPELREVERRPYAVLLHATSRAEKLWPEDRWLALVRELHERGMGTILPWGSADERARSERLAQAVPEAWVPPRLRLDAFAGLLGGARAVIGVDTGLTHLAVALGRPSIGLYCATEPGLNGVFGGATAINLGGMGTPPSVLLVLGYLQRLTLR